VLTDSYIQAAEVARRRVGADYAMGLVLEEDGGRVTGQIHAPTDLPSYDAGCEYSFLCKEKGVRALAKRLDARLERTVMIGDSDPDACAMEVVGLGIAYRPIGTRVPQAATHTVEGRDLRQVLEILGVPGIANST
jgi:phosphoserine phosphatase